MCYINPRLYLFLQYLEHSNKYVPVYYSRDTIVICAMWLCINYSVNIATNYQVRSAPTHVDLFRSLRTALTLIKTMQPRRANVFVFDSIHVSLHDNREWYWTMTKLLVHTYVNK